MTLGLFGYSALSEVSLIAIIDGEDCGEESTLKYYGLILWISLAIYLMVGQFVICEEYFVPLLARLGDKWKMSEDVQGATLLAVGSSSPELFTALLGVIFYPNDNPGPGTNVGSAVFNLCIIIGLSAIFAPKSAKLQMIPFLRDSIAYLIGLVQLYLFYSVVSPGYMELWESILLTLWWIFYVIMVYRTDLLANICCCCVPDREVNKVIEEIEINVRNSVWQRKQKPNANGDNNNKYVAMTDMDEDTYEDEPEMPSFMGKPTVLKTNEDQTQLAVQYDDRGHPINNFDEIEDNIQVIPGAINAESINNRLPQILDKELNRKQRQNVNKGWMVVIAPLEEDEMPPSAIPLMNPTSFSDESIKIKKEKLSSHAYVRRRTLMETLSHEAAVAEAQIAHNIAANGNIQTAVVNEENHDDVDHSKGIKILHKFLSPWTFIYKYTLPAPEGSFANKHIYLSIFAIVIWLGILTFLVVDSAEKIGNCFKMPGGLLGITLLAIGSSLPDCISSIIVARQMKIDMAVANAFGSNIFDVNLCVGFSFILGSISNALSGKDMAIFLGDGEALTTFSELIIAAAMFMVFLWIMIWCSSFRLQKWIGYVLSASYVGYICVFTVLFIHDQEDGDDFGES